MKMKKLLATVMAVATMASIATVNAGAAQLIKGEVFKSGKSSFDRNSNDNSWHKTYELKYKDSSYINLVTVGKMTYYYDDMSGNNDDVKTKMSGEWDHYAVVETSEDEDVDSTLYHYLKRRIFGADFNVSTDWITLKDSSWARFSCGTYVD